MRRGTSEIREAEPGRRGLWTSILVFRWTALVLMGILSAFVDVVRPALAVALFATVMVWNLGLTARGSSTGRATRWIDLGVSATVLLTAPLVVAPGSLTRFPFLAAAYPLATVLTWAAATGVRGGWFAGGVLSVALVLSRPLNSLSYRRLPTGEILSVATGCVYYALAAFVVGLFAETIDGAAADVRSANERVVVEHERAARLEERDALARALHDSILQTLALVQRTIRELAPRAGSAGRELLDLGGVVQREERELRGLLRRGVEEPPEGSLALRTVLEAAAFGVDRVAIQISTVEPAWLRADHTAEVTAAVRQAVENAAEHAQAEHLTLFGEDVDGEILITVVDDGRGFEYDETRLAADGRLGIAKSMKGRIERVGGSMRIVSSPGRGTTVEFRLPADG
jgi:signal transduction histidine kinase